MAPGRTEWQFGIFVGLQNGGLGNDSLMGASHAGPQKAAQFRALPASDRWDVSAVLAMKGWPWDWLETTALRTGRVFLERAPDPVDLPPHAVPHARSSKAVYLRRDVELARYGHTPGCPGCTAAAFGAQARPTLRRAAPA